jgi:adenine-specific DNA-methyltransferase
VSAPDLQSVTELVQRTRSRALTADPAALKSTYELVLRELDGRGVDRSWRDGFDALGAAYMQLLPAQYRRARGQVFTPTWAATLMATWALQELRSGIAVDAGVGSGVLLLAAARARTTNSRVRLLGIDVDPTAVLMTRTNAALRGLGIEARRGNFLLDEIAERPEAILCNPPYTRHHALSAAEKEEIATTLGKRLGLRHTRRASLHALFLARAVEIAANGARIAFITPSQWLETNYGREVKEFVEKRASVVAVIDFDTNLFPQVRTSTSITLIEKRAADTAPIHLSLRDPLPKPGAVLHTLARGTVTEAPRRRARSHRRGTVQLAELARVHRGVATGHNRFFVLSDSDRRHLRLNRSYLRPCITSPRLFAGTTLTAKTLAALPADTPRWLLTAKSEPSRGPLAEYLAYGRAIGADTRYLCAQRTPWFSIRWHGAFPILFSYLNKNNPRFIRNDAEAVPLNTWLVVRPKEGVDVDALFAALSDANVLAQAKAAGRHYGSGLWKLEPSEIERLWVPQI